MFGLVAVVASLLIGTSVAAQDAPAFSGQLLSDGEPVPGVVITVSDVDGSFSESATTDADGRWTVTVPSKRATYSVVLDVATLPEGVELAEDASSELEISITQPGQQRSATFALGDRGTEGVPIGEQVAQAALNGVKLGLIIAMCAIGLSLIFGTTGLINFAHGELVSFGAIMAYWLNVEWLRLPLIVAALIAMLATAVLGGVTESWLMRPLRAMKLGAFQFVVITIGLSLIGRQLLQMWIGGEKRSYREYQIQEPWDLGIVDVTPRDASIMAIAVVCLIATASALQYSRTGKATRAVADNPTLASASGIPVDSVILKIWVAGAALAGLGGVLFGLSETLSFDVGFRLLLLIFAAVVLGGLGTAYGAMVGGLAIGLVTEVSTVWVQTELKFVWALLALIIVLLVRPQGILGQKERVG